MLFRSVNENMITLFLNTTKITEDIDDAQEKAMITNIRPRFGMGPKSNGECPYTKGRHTETHRKEPRDSKGGDWSDVPTRQGTLGTTRSWKRQGKMPSWGLQKECGPASILVLDFWPLELRKNTFLLS